MKAISDRVADKESSLAFAQKGVKQMTSYVNSWLRGLNEFIKNNPEAKADTVNELVAMLRGEKPKQWNGEKIGPQETAADLSRKPTKSATRWRRTIPKRSGLTPGTLNVPRSIWPRPRPENSPGARRPTSLKMP